MTVVSVNVSRPKRVQVREGTVLTSIFKSPVEGRVAVRRHNSPAIGNLTYGPRRPYKAVYSYPEEHYSFGGAIAGHGTDAGIFGGI